MFLVRGSRHRSVQSKLTYITPGILDYEERETRFSQAVEANVMAKFSIIWRP